MVGMMLNNQMQYEEMKEVRMITDNQAEILKYIREWGEAYGYQIREDIDSIQPNTIWVTLRRLEKRGILKSAEKPGDEGKPARVMYSLTANGERVLRAWEAMKEALKG